MGQAKLRAKDREERVRLAVQKATEKVAAEKQKEVDRLVAMSPEELRQEELKKQKLRRSSLLLTAALGVGGGSFLKWTGLN